MNRSALFTLFAGLLQVMPAVAQPCVGAAYDKPLPGAVDVVIRHADVPASQFPGIWQEGLIGGNFYQIFSNRVAVLRADRLSQDWSVTVECQQRPCLTTVTGTPPDAVKASVTQLEQCLVPPEVKLAAAPAKPKPEKAKPEPPEPQKSAIEAPEEPKPKDEVTPTDPVPARVAAPKTPDVTTGSDAAQPTPGMTTSPETQGTPMGAGKGQPSGGTAGTTTGRNTGPATEVVCAPASQPIAKLRPLTCGLSVVPPGTPETTLQRLLVLAGADPGPIDGAIGSKTKDAVVLVLGFAGRTMDLQQSITAVDAYLCREGLPLP